MKRSPKLDLPPIMVRRHGRQLPEQLCRALRSAIATGALAPGSRLPSSRVLARMLGVSRNTVLVAYETLSSEGLITGRVGSGTLVCAQSGLLLRLLAASSPDRLGRLRESGFPLRRVAFRDPDGHAFYLHS
jgi:GntR family transcriptional regulator / MocR family aminotransferase